MSYNICNKPFMSTEYEFSDQNGRETAHFRLVSNSSEDETPSLSPPDEASQKDERNRFWNYVQNDVTLKNITSAIIINLNNLSSFESVLSNVSKMFICIFE